MNELVEKTHEGELMAESELTEREEIAKGRAIVATAERCMWDIGKWYVGVQYRRDPKNSSHETKKLSCSEVCRQVNIPVARAGHAANVYRYFGATDDRTLAFTHYILVLPLIASQGEEAGRQMMQAAKLGERFKGEFEDYGYKDPWNREDITRAVKIAMGKLKLVEKSDPIVKGEKALEDKIEQVIENSTLPKAKKASVKKAIDCEVKAVMADLQKSYTDQVGVEAKKMFNEQIGERTETLRDRESKLKADTDRMYRRDMAINGIMTEAEFHKLRSFCHPDKNPGREEEAQEVFAIVQKLKNSFRPAGKKALEKQGWKK